jgi:tryptophan synthase alpha chain
LSALSARLEEARLGGRKLLVPYVMGGQPDRDTFLRVLTAVSRSADALEVGLPYSDPLMDGPVIAAAGERSIRAGVGPSETLELVAAAERDVCHLIMTYYNPIHSAGEKGFCALAAKAGVSGLIVPDLPLEESEGLRRAAAEEGLAWIPLVAPTSSPRRVAAIAATATGFVYAVSVLGVTGTREQLSERAAAVAAACKEATDLAVLVGIGVSSPEHARAAALYSDGVVVGSAVVKLIAESGAEGAAAFLTEVREALDEAAETA